MVALTGLALEFTLVLLAVLLALWFRPWQVLRARVLQAPWAAAMLLLAWLWSVQVPMPGGALLQMSGACLLVLMFGWPLTVLSLPAIAALGGWIGGVEPRLGFALLAWNGVLPATLALVLGGATRRWLPVHLLVYIMARGFLVTALAVSLASIAGLFWQGLPAMPPQGDSLVGHWLIAWGEAVATGLLTAVLVVYRPQWLLTYSDRLYLPSGRRS